MYMYMYYRGETKELLDLRTCEHFLIGPQVINKIYMWWMRDECCLLYRRHGWVIISYNILWYIIIYPCLTFGTWVLCGLNTVLWWMLVRAVNPLTTGKLGISQHCCYWWPEVLVSGHQQFQAWFYTFRARPVWFKQTDRVGSKSHL